MKKRVFLFLCSVVALAACSGHNNVLSPGNEANGEKNESNNESGENDSDDEGVDDVSDINDETSESEENKNEDESNEERENEGATIGDDTDTELTPEAIIEKAVLAEEQLESYTLEWTFHDIAEDGVVMEARDSEIQHFYKNDDGADYFFRHTTGLDEEGNPSTIYEGQTPEVRTLYRELDHEVVLMEPADEFVPTIARGALAEDFLGEDSSYHLTYEGIYEVNGYRAHQIHAVTEKENVEINMWFDTETGLQVRQNSFFAGYDGVVSILTMVETGIEFDEEMFEVEVPADIQVRDERQQ